MPAGFTLIPRGPFDLRESAAFVAGFAPISADTEDGELAMAFSEDSGAAVAFRARQPDGPCGEVEVEWAGEVASGRIREAVARILSLDVDGAAFAKIGERDPVVAGLQRRFPGRRPVCFGGPFEAACWAVLSQRTPIARAAILRDRLTAELGEAITVSGHRLTAPPAPQTIANLDGRESLWPVKVQRLRALAEAALAGLLDATALRALEPAAALERLRALPGIGPFGATLILARGAGHPDVLPLAEGRFRKATAAAYSLDPVELSDERLTELAEGWRPFRSWVAFLARNASG